MPALSRTIDAVLVDLDALTLHDQSGTLRTHLTRLAAGHVALGLLTAHGLGELDGTLDALHREGGPVLLATGNGDRLHSIDARGVRLRRTDVHPDVGGWALLLAGLADVGIAPRDVLLVAPGCPDTGCGFTAEPADAAALFDEQLQRRAAKRVPTVEGDDGWTVTDAGPSLRRPGAQAAVFTVGNGEIATRGVAEEDPGGAAVLASGTYLGEGAKQHLRPAPGWTALELRGPAGGQRRVLDLRAGVLYREELGGELPLRTLRFASVVRPGIQVLRAEAAASRLSAGPPLQPPAEGVVEGGRDDGVTWARTTGDVGGIAAVAVQDVVDDGPLRTVERLAAYRRDSRKPPDVDLALDALSEAARVGFDGLLAEHRREWTRRWDAVDVEIPDDPAAQQAFRFALFQLWSNVGCPTDRSGAWAGSERGVGARGLSGQGYGGHVFWDADVFVLPAMATICPAAARAMLEYRIRRLAGARSRAAAEGRSGARFPWESARDGDEVTPTSGLVGKEILQIRTGELEEHIVADVAWGADRYAAWTGDSAVLTGEAQPLIVETARYWASRIARTPDGRGHIGGVIGPDEYHEGVDDNAFTNILARWNLRRGAQLTPNAREALRWRALADELVDGYDPVTRRHEQFAGYNRLERLVVAGLAEPPFAADVLLGRGRIWRSQLIKQPDVLMAHYMVPDELPAGSLVADLDFYEPRTSHGSSLSPAITAALMARAGRPDAGLEMLRLALRLDLDDITQTSTGGLHLATIGGTWSALVNGFLGLRVQDGVLHADPHLPSAWGVVRIRLNVLHARVALSVSPDQLILTTDRRLRFRPDGAETVEVGAGSGARFDRRDGGWRLTGGVRNVKLMKR